jgi:hypothetical protein
MELRSNITDFASFQKNRDSRFPVVGGCQPFCGGIGMVLPQSTKKAPSQKIITDLSKQHLYTFKEWN